MLDFSTDRKPTVKHNGSAHQVQISEAECINRFDLRVQV